jgi:hypothetical protein
MTDTSGYWDVHRCAWVGAPPAYVVPPVAGPAGASTADPREVPALPEQRATAEVPAVQE